jgi:hypothetical protein
MLYPGDNCARSVPVVLRRKAQCDGNGHALVGRCNAAAGQDTLIGLLATPTGRADHRLLPDQVHQLAKISLKNNCMRFHDRRSARSS